MAIRRRSRGRKKSSSRPKKANRRSRRGRGSAQRHRKKQKLKKTKKRGSSGLNRNKLLDILTVPNSYSLQIGDQCIANGSSSTAGVLCQYFHCNGSVGAANKGYNLPQSTYPVTSLCPGFMLKIASIINNNAQPDIKFFQTDFLIKHAISNACNFDITLKAWLCESRHDQINTGTQYPLNILGQGFASTGVNSVVTQYTNSGLQFPDLTPFNSPDFCEAYKIVKSVSRKIKGGDTVMFSIHDKRKHVVHPNRFCYMAATQTYLTCTQNIMEIQGGRFWLFRIESRHLGDEVGANTTLSSEGPKVNMLTDVQYQYKYIQDSNVNNFSANATNIATANQPEITNRSTMQGIIEATT
nr:MAG: capsid protein [Cressdnaviricota sp.]